MPISFASTLPPLSTLNELTKTRVQNSISSWGKHLAHQGQVLILSDDQPSCDWLLSFSNVDCLVHDCTHDSIDRPTMSCIFESIVARAVTDVVCWLNADILLPDLFSKSVKTVFSQIDSDVLVVGQRKDVAVSTLLRLDEGWEQEIQRTVQQEAVHKAWGIDIFIFSKSVLKKIPMLQFIVGAWRWDNYWLSQAILSKDITVVDMTSCMSVFHQGIDAAGDRDGDHRVRVGAEWNDQLTKKTTSNLFLLGLTSNADMVLTNNFQLRYNMRKSDLVRAAQHITKPNAWVTFIHTDASKISHWTRWAQNERFYNFVFVLESCPPRFEKMSRVICRKATPRAPSELTEASELLTTSHLTSEFLLSLFPLNISFTYVSLLDSPSEGILPTLELRTQPCDVIVTETKKAKRIPMVRANKKTKLFWKLVIKCQKKGWFGPTGENAMVSCLINLVAKQGANYNLNVCTL